MLEQYILKLPRCACGGKGALENISGILRQNQIKKVCVFTDRSIRAAGLLDLILRPVQESGADCAVLDALFPEPTYAQVQAVADQFRSTQADFIIAVGGGSVMDAAKLSAVLASDAYTVKDLLEDPGKAKKHVKTLMVPTTAGTGAEATPNAIVAVPEKELKVGIVSDEMVPDYVILDAVMIENLPGKIAAATGVDALAHAIECWTSRKANPFSDLYALRALDLILNNILQACSPEKDMNAKSQMLIASFFAGIAITASGTTAVHALSYPLGGKYHIAHGVSNAMLLAPVMRFNEPACRGRLAAAYDSCCHTEPRLTTAEEKSAYMLTWLERIVRELEIPTSLKAFGVDPADLDGLVASGMEVTRLLNNNLRPVTKEDAADIYRQILK